MLRKAFSAVLVLALAAPLAFGAASDKWLHIRVEEGGSDGTRVRINLPLSLVMNVLPHIEFDEFHHGRIDLEEILDSEVGEVDVRAILAEVRDAPDAEFVAIDGPDATVRVRKDGNFILVHVEDTGGSETVDVRMPLAVVDALLSADSDELDLAAAIEALAEYGDGDLVTVQSDDEMVRIWIDDLSTMPEER